MLRQPVRLFEEVIASPIGELIVLTDSASAVRAVDFEDYRPRLERLLRLHYGFGGWALQPAACATEAALRLTDYFAGNHSSVEQLQTFTGGSEFQRSVWRRLREIPAGKSVAYADIATSIGRPRAVRAVGQANGANPIAIIVPCHRVIGSSGKLTGYGGGVARKQWLLEHER